MKKEHIFFEYTNGLRVDKVCTWDPVKLLFYWSDFKDLTGCRTELKLLLPLLLTRMSTGRLP